MLRSKNYLTFLAISFPLLLASCAGEEDDPTPGTVNIQQCNTYQSVFDNNVWPVLVANCLTCHEINGVNSELTFLPESYNNYAQTNFNTFQKVAIKTDNKGVSRLIYKPVNANNDHGGGNVLDDGSVEHIAISELVANLSNCASDSLQIEALDLGTDYQRLRKATLALAGRLPTTAEEKQIETLAGNSAQKEIAFGTILDELLTSEYYFERLKIMFNDLFLTDFVSGAAAVGQFDFRNYSNENYYDTANLIASYPVTADQRNLRNKAGQGLTQAPLELIAHVARENRPFTEILTANYLLVNPYSATIYSADVGDASFNFVYGDAVDLHDPNDFREAIIFDKNSVKIPHAGILTSPAFLFKYQTTKTNRNRARSRVVFSYFLDINVLGLANRASLNLDNVIGKYPTFEDPQCRACHDTVDPLAGIYKNWNNRGAYLGDNLRWFNTRNPQQMLAPGFSMDAVDQLPSLDSGKAVQWLAANIANNSGFSDRVVKQVFKGFTGQDLPIDFNYIESLKNNFVSSNFNIKVLTKAVINSPYFLAINLSAEADATLFPNVGMSRLLTPELLDRKIQAVTGGYRWRSPSNLRLSDVNSYKIFYGGIDSGNVTARTTTPTVLITGTQRQIANQIACKVVPVDFNKSTNRVLFPLVTMTDIPDDADGSLQIKNNIVYLFKHLLAEQLTIDSAEVSRAYDLFVTVYDLTVGEGLPSDCNNGLAATNPVRVDTNKTVRSWMALSTYLLSDYRFFYE